jgi:hypothetical protein
MNCTSRNKTKVMIVEGFDIDTPKGAEDYLKHHNVDIDKYIDEAYAELVQKRALNLASVSGMLRFINALRQTDRYIEMIYMNGACYQFHLLLKTFFPESKPYINKEKDHVITKYAGKYYDITGEASGNWYTPMTESEIEIASEWSFHRTKVIQIGECPFCEEPIVV